MEREEVTVRRRVKLYLLNEENEWDDGGTGYVAVVMAQNQTDMNLLVNSEADSSALLDTKIDIDVAYQKQQDTLIVWFDNEAQNNLALSFQEAAGCDEIWAKICQVHGKPATVKSTGDDEEGSPKDSSGGQHRNSMRMNSASSMSLPPCDLAHLDDLLTAIRDNSRMPNRREKLANAIESGGYIQKLTQLFRMAEDLESTEILVKLYEIIKMLFHLNRSSLLDIMLADAMVMDVVGILEYDPSLKEQAGHRKFLCDRARFHQVLPIKNKELLAKIERTFRLQYIQDIVQPLPLTILDTDTTLSALSSQIYFNKMDIVMSIQNDGPFLDQLFRQLMSATYCDDAMSTASSLADDEFSHNSIVSTPSGSEKDHDSSGRPSYAKALGDLQENKNGSSEDELIESAHRKDSTNSSSNLNGNNGNSNNSNRSSIRNGGENHVDMMKPEPGKLISDEHRLELVLLLRELCNYAHSLQPEQRADFIKRLADHRICAAIEQLLALDSVDIRQAAIDIFASLVDFSPSMIRDYALHSSSDDAGADEGLISLVIAELLNDTDPELGSAFHLSNLLRLLLDPENMMTTSANRMEKVDFLSLFYKNCMHALVAPLLAVTSDCRKPSRDDYKTALQLNLIVDLLTFCLEVHGPHIRRYIIARDLIRRVLVLIKSRHLMLVLSALRFFRRMIGLKDITYTEHIITNSLFEPVIDIMLANARDNMLRAAVHELFQFIRNEAIDEVIVHLIDRFGERLPPNGNRPDPLGTFSWMRERSALVREQTLSAPRGMVSPSPDSMTSPSTGWTSANSRAQLLYASSGLPSVAGLSNFMRNGSQMRRSSQSESDAAHHMVLQQSVDRIMNSPGITVLGSASATSTMNASGGTTARSASGNTVSYLDDDDLVIEDDERWFENDEPASANNPDVIHQGGEPALADVGSVTNGISAGGPMEEADENERIARPHSAPAGNNLSPQGSTSEAVGSSEAVLDQLHQRMIEARRARADDDVLSPSRTFTSTMTTATLIPVGSSGGIKRSTSALTISINVTSATGKISPVVSPSLSTTSIRTSLVDYESDSDDDNAGSDGEETDGGRRSKKKKGGSGADDGESGDNELDKGSQKRLRSSTSPIDPPIVVVAAAAPATGSDNGGSDNGSGDGDGGATHSISKTTGEAEEPASAEGRSSPTPQPEPASEPVAAETSYSSSSTTDQG